jgi:hypothetical protein
MKRRALGLSLALIVVVCSLCTAGLAQQQSDAASTNAVPRVVNYSGILADLNGKPLTQITGVTFFLYTAQQGGAPLWVETQNVHPDKNGHYTVMLGSTTSEGLPEEVFVSGEARWLGVQVQGQEEQPRVLLVSVPYALKAHDAETIGGLPPSAFMLAVPTASSANSASTSSSTSSQVSPALSGSGTTGFLPEFSSATTIGNSAVFQTGTSPTAKIGVNTATPATPLDVVGAGTIRGLLTLPATGAATAAAGKNSQAQDFVASAFNSTTKAAVSQAFFWQAEPAGNDTAAPSGTLNLLFSSGGAAAAETGLKVSNKGLFTFAAGQKFPGTGTVSSVASGAGLSGGPITGSGTLSIATGGVTNAMLQHSTTTVTAGAGLTGGGAIALGGAGTLTVATAGVSNAMLSHPSLTVTAGTGLSGGGAVALGSSITLANAGVLSVGGGNGINSTGGQKPALSINTSVVPTLAGVNDFTGFSDFDGKEPDWEVEVSNSGAGHAIIASNTSSSPDYPTLALTNNDSTGAGDLVLDAVGSSFGGECSFDVSGNLFCTGALSAAVKTAANQASGVYSVQSPENWIEDFGSAELVGGVATINLDPGFAKTISEKAGYHVFVTPAGDCEGLYVAARSASSFEVRELKSGTSNVAFDYRIVAHRKGLDGVRLPDVSNRLNRRAQPSSQQRALAKKLNVSDAQRTAVAHP